MERGIFDEASCVVRSYIFVCSLLHHVYLAICRMVRQCHSEQLESLGLCEEHSQSTGSERVFMLIS